MGNFTTHIMLHTAITSVLDNHKGQLQFVNSGTSDHKE
jgi:hypothetical protein